MQAPANIAATLSTRPIAADSPAAVASIVGITGADTPFAALLRGQEGGAADQAAANPELAQQMVAPPGLAVFPQPADFAPAADILPEPAATGKLLPLPGKRTANPRQAEAVAGAAASVIQAQITALVAPLANSADIGCASVGEVAAPDAAAGICQLIDPALDAASTGLVQPMPMQEIPAQPAGPPLASAAARPISPMADPARTKTEGASHASGITTAAPATAQLASATSAASVSAAPAVVAPIPAAGQVTVSITAAPGAAAVLVDQAITTIVPDERVGQPAAALSATEQLGARTAARKAADGEPSQSGAREGSSRRAPAIDVSAPAARSSAADIFPAVAATPAVVMDRAAAAPAPAAPAMAAAGPDRAATVAHVVDRLMAAREIGLGALASIAIENRDFGDLTVSFSDKGSLLHVSVTAADAEKQRALAAALTAAERPASREPAAQNNQASSNTAAAALQQDRGAEGQRPHDNPGRHPRGEAMTEQRRTGPSAVSATESNAATPQRSGIYV